MFTSLISLSTVELGTNSWDCTCDLAWLSTWSLYTGIIYNINIKRDHYQKNNKLIFRIRFSMFDYFSL
jgi:hypothetical protein